MDRDPHEIVLVSDKGSYCLHWGWRLLAFVKPALWISPHVLAVQELGTVDTDLWVLSRNALRYYAMRSISERP